MAVALPLVLLAVLGGPAIDDASALASMGARLAPAKGRFLVASDQLHDTNFAESVVLLLEYGDEGALGVIVNRPTRVLLSSALPAVEELKDRKDVVYLGGPVAPDAIVMVMRASAPPAESRLVFDDVYFATSAAALRGAIRRRGSNRSFRAYVGYAGWGPGQLEGEVARGDWLIAGAEARIVFHDTPARVWPEMNSRLEGDWVRNSIWLAAAPPAGGDS